MMTKVLHFPIGIATILLCFSIAFVSTKGMLWMADETSLKATLTTWRANIKHQIPEETMIPLKISLMLKEMNRK